MEEWKKVEGTSGMIEVSNTGKVRSFLRGQPYELKSQADNKGYRRISVTIKREKFTFKVHRLVAQAFIDNPLNLPQVNHIDGDKSNNAASNLEWISNKDNAAHAIKAGLWENVFIAANKNNLASRKPIIATKDDERMRFESVCEAQKYFDSRHITDVLKGKRDHVKGWAFCYESEVMAR